MDEASLAGSDRSMIQAEEEAARAESKAKQDGKAKNALQKILDMVSGKNN
jgi:hypothetical protein